MYLPEQTDKLNAVAEKTQAAYDTAIEKGKDPSAAEFSARIAFVDPETIGHYVSAYLSDIENLQQSTPEVRKVTLSSADKATKDSTKDWINQNPHARATYNTLHEILSCYFEDMSEVTAIDKGAAHDASDAFLKEVGFGVIWEELLPEMIRGMSEDQRSRMKGEDILEGLSATFETGVFDRETGSCPFQHRIFHVFALKPERDPETDEVTIVGREKGALLAFIHNELKHGIGANNVPAETAEHD